MCWKTETTLGELPRDQTITIDRPGRHTIRTTPAALMEEARFPPYFTLDQVEFAFSTDS